MTFQGKEITLENLSPVFTPEQEAAKRRELEQQLYEVFRKYADKLFDYWSVDSIRRWRNGGKFDNKFLNEDEKQLKQFYKIGRAHV